MTTVTKLSRIRKTVENHLKSGDLELVVIPRTKYEALIENLEDLKDLRDSIEALKEYRSGRTISFDKYHARRTTKRV